MRIAQPHTDTLVAMVANSTSVWEAADRDFASVVGLL